MDKEEAEIFRLRAIIRQAIWDFEMGRPDMAIVCLRYAGLDEAPITEKNKAIKYGAVNQTI